MIKTWSMRLSQISATLSYNFDANAAVIGDKSILQPNFLYSHYFEIKILSVWMNNQMRKNTLKLIWKTKYTQAKSTFIPRLDWIRLDDVVIDEMNQGNYFRLLQLQATKVFLLFVHSVVFFHYSSKQKPN